MDESNRALFNKLKVIGPLLFFVIIFAVMYKFTDVGLIMSALVAGAIAILDYFMLIIVLKKVSK